VSKHPSRLSLGRSDAVNGSSAEPRGQRIGTGAMLRSVQIRFLEERCRGYSLRFLGVKVPVSEPPAAGHQRLRQQQISTNSSVS
jgi:hypothetical protein